MTSAVAIEPGLPKALTGRRRELMDAAITVVASGGLRGLTHRAVDAQAGVPQGSTSSYYRTRSALLTALTAHVATRLLPAVERSRERIAMIDDSDPEAGEARFVEEVVALVVGQAARPELVRLQAELMLEAVRTPELLTILAPWRARLIELVAGIECEVRPEYAGDRAETTVAAFQGVLLTSLLQPDDQRAAYVERATRQLIELLRSGPT